jgi:YfiH family protein
VVWRRSGEVRWLEAELPGAVAAFSARTGGVSAAPWDELNLGLLTGDRPAAVRENRSRLAAGLGLDPGRVVIGRQVHGVELAAHEHPQSPAPFAARGSEAPEVDGHHTAEADLGLLVFVADCLPIAIAGAERVAILHGGWRGLAAGLLERGTAAVDGTAAAVGPGIGPCCFEVGNEVLAAFGSLGDGIAVGRMLDLREVARRLLVRSGVERIEISDLCTRCNPDLFFSHRGQGPETGRQAGLVWKRA